MILEFNKENLKQELIRLFAMADSWFDKEELLHFKPSGNASSVLQVIEQTVSTNGFILATMENGFPTAKVQECTLNELVADRLDDPPPEKYLKLSLQEGEYSVCDCRYKRAEVWNRLRWQLYQCLDHLEIVNRTEDSRNEKSLPDPGDLLRLIGLNMKYGLTQMERAEVEYHAALID